MAEIQSKFFIFVLKKCHIHSGLLTKRYHNKNYGPFWWCTFQKNALRRGDFLKIKFAFIIIPLNLIRSALVAHSLEGVSPFQFPELK